MDQKVNQLTKTVESLQKQLGEVTKMLHTFNSNKGQDVNPHCSDIPQIMQLENSVSSEDTRSLAINSNVDGLLSRPRNSDLVGQSNTQNFVLMGHTIANTLMVDSSECSGSHPLLPNLTVCTDNTCNINMSNTLQQTLPLGAMVSDTIKNKIWANEYVDLGILLPNGDVKSQVFPIVINGVGNEKKLALQENSNKNSRPVDFCFFG